MKNLFVLMPCQWQNVPQGHLCFARSARQYFTSYFVHSTSINRRCNLRNEVNEPASQVPQGRHFAIFCSVVLAGLCIVCVEPLVRRLKPTANKVLSLWDCRYRLAIITTLICFAFLAHDLSAQSLLDVYKKGVVKLTPDTEYAQGNQWDKVFESYFDKTFGNRKSIILMPNGSVVVNNPNRNFYSLFDANGKFVKEFGITGSSGTIAGVINNNFFTGPDNMGKMVCFDFNGNYVKTLTLDYMTRQMTPMSNNKIAVVGRVIWKDRFRDFVAIVDYQTNNQKIIWEHFTPIKDERGQESGNNSRKMFRYSYRFEKEGWTVGLSTMPYPKDTRASQPQIAFVNDRLIVALSHNGEILAYDVNGKLITKDKIEWGLKYLSVEEQKEIQKKAIEKHSSEESEFFRELNEFGDELMKAKETILKQMEGDLEKITTPIPISVSLFSNIIKDSDNNLLFFEIPESKGANKFNVWVYQNGGKFVCQSSFVCDEYDLAITPSKMVFHNGYIYALQTLKNATGNPLRLVRFKVSN